MFIRKTTLATAILLGFGLNADAAPTAVAADSYGRMNEAHGYPGYGHLPMTRPGGYDYGPYGKAMMHPATYWGGQEPKLVKTGMANPEAAAPGTIVEVAVGAGSFQTLVAAVKAAGLVETLEGEGPFTVFAPTDEAFAKIPKDQLDALLADKQALTAVLTYHVLPGKVMAADVVGLDSATTVQGSNITIDTSDGVKVDNANVVKTDIEASNGVIHVIDAVIMPK